MTRPTTSSKDTGRKVAINRPDGRRRSGGLVLLAALAIGSIVLNPAPSIGRPTRPQAALSAAEQRELRDLAARFLRHSPPRHPEALRAESAASRRAARLVFDAVEREGDLARVRVVVNSGVQCVVICRNVAGRWHAQRVAPRERDLVAAILRRRSSTGDGLIEAAAGLSTERIQHFLREAGDRRTGPGRWEYVRRLNALAHTITDRAPASPGAGWCWEWTGAIDKDTGRYAAALQDFRRALVLQPQFGDITAQALAPVTAFGSQLVFPAPPGPMQQVLWWRRRPPDDLA